MGTRLTIDDLRDKADEIRGDNYSYEFHAGKAYGRYDCVKEKFTVRYGSDNVYFRTMQECLNWMQGFQAGIAATKDSQKGGEG